MRRKNAPEIWGDPDSQSLDKSFCEWQANSAVLENELEFRYGQASRPVIKWHQVRDLLTVRYFELPDQADPDLLARNARGYQDRDHSGLTEDELKNTELLLQTYHSAMRELADELGRAVITL